MKLITAAAATLVVVVLAVTSVMAGKDTAASDDQQALGRAGIVVGDVPVWWDTTGLHHGDIVENTPVQLTDPTADPQIGALALVRTGAVYLDPATGDVWFHPWGGEPRIVGHNSQAGPGGDPDGDTAAWFEGSVAEEADGEFAGWAGPGDLVVYDTAADREVSRTMEARGVYYACCEHRPAGNGFLEVSTDGIVWTSGDAIFSHDVRTRSTSEVGWTEMNVPGGADRYPDLESAARLSPSGAYVLAVENTEQHHGAVIIDTRTGELWRVPRNVYPWIAWSYGDIAMVDHTGDELLACDAARHVCQSVPATHPLLVPTN